MAIRKSDTNKPAFVGMELKKICKCLMNSKKFMFGHIGERVCPSYKKISI